MTTHKLILDGDYGIDDSLAALFLAHQPDVEILAVGSVHGNATTEAAARNALAVLEIGGRPAVPVAVGAAQPLAQPVHISALVHGDDGLGGQAPPVAPGRVPAAVAAAVQLVDTVRAHPGECTIVATGPLTNLALALLLDPDLASLVADVVVMGGTVEHPGNINPFAEANIAHDPEAARLVFAAPWRVTQVGLDVTMATWLEPADLDRIQGSDTAAGRFAWRILPHYLAFYFERHGRPGCPLHDPTAAILAVDPGLASWIEMPVEVELRSDRCRGMLLVDRRPFAAAGRAAELPLVRVVTELDRDRLVARFLDGLLTDPIPLAEPAADSIG
jgi:purine nucleosidase